MTWCPQAEAAVPQLQQEGWSVCLFYNTRAYDGKFGRGWTTLEQGAAMTSAAHLSAAERAGQLSKSLSHAHTARPKLIDISGGQPNTVKTDADPRQLLIETSQAIANAVFTGKGDREVVQQLLAEFDQTISQALAEWAASAAAAATETDYGGVVLEMAGACW